MTLCLAKTPGGGEYPACCMCPVEGATLSSGKLCEFRTVGRLMGLAMSEQRVAPKASSLIEAMRDIGYSLETALADVIDNSIAAGAKNISIEYDLRGGDPWIAVADDGRGIDAAELLEAMRPGSRNPLETRDANDLGRFGLGLKTASFSQCRQLTVIGRRKSQTCGARWDLDYVAERDDWLLQLPPAFDVETVPGLSDLGRTGVLVVWEKLDRLADTTTGASLSDHLLDRLDSARSHLELVFHRFLEGERGLRKVTIRMNGRELQPFDPFNRSNRATQRLTEDPIKVGGAVVLVQPYILPHHNKVSVTEWEKYAGEGGYVRNQGFYLYRGGRLIIHGTWFRLARQTELTKLARVQIDMPNGLDHFWKIDVRKASAQPPFVVRERLRRIIDAITEPSRRVYVARGHRLASDSPAVLWHRRVDKGQVTYEINREHPVLLQLASQLPDERGDELETFLKGLERGFPVDAVFSDAATNPTGIAQSAMAVEDLTDLVRLTVRALAAQEVALDVILKDLAAVEPYRSSWSAAEPLIRAEYESQASVHAR